MDTEIHHINFGVYSAEEIKRMAVCKINSSKLIDDNSKKTINEDGEILLLENYKNNKSKIGTVYDERMGTIDHKQNCETCKLSFKECPGHFGYIDLSIPILHPLYIKEICQFLKCFCHHCYNFILSEDLLKLYDILQYKKISRFKKILNKIEKIDICYICNMKQYTLSCLPNDGIIHIIHKEKGSNTIVIPLETDIIKKIFDNITDDHVRILGFDPKLIHPKNLILTVLPVMPPSARAPVITENHICDDDLTLQLIEIIKANNYLEDDTINENKRQKFIQTLKFRIKTLMNNKQKAKHTISNRPIKCIGKRLEGKSGFIRSNLMGKRVNQSARTVIGPDPNIRTDEVTIPELIAKDLTCPVKVTYFNIETLTKLVNEGKAKRIIRKKINTEDNQIKERIINVEYALNQKQTRLHYNDIILRNNKEIIIKNPHDFTLRFGDKVKRNGIFLNSVKYPNKKEIVLEIGDTVERFLQNGDIVLLNRQPTLWKGSMLAQKVVIKPHKTIRFNLAICNSLNGDFDGAGKLPRMIKLISI